MLSLLAEVNSNGLALGGTGIAGMAMWVFREYFARRGSEEETDRLKSANSRLRRELRRCRDALESRVTPRRTHEMLSRTNEMLATIADSLPDGDAGATIAALRRIRVDFETHFGPAEVSPGETAKMVESIRSTLDKIFERLSETSGPEHARKRDEALKKANALLKELAELLKASRPKQPPGE